jgi:hypothetical protein
LLSKYSQIKEKEKKTRRVPLAWTILLALSDIAFNQIKTNKVCPRYLLFLFLFFFLKKKGKRSTFFFFQGKVLNL